MADDFYVGYLPRAPAPIGRFVRRVVVLLLLGAAVVSLCLVFLQSRFDPGSFEFGVVREFTGVLRAEPYAHLELVPSGSARPSSSLLVAFGKHGAAGSVAGLDGERVRVRGSLIEREGQTMIELVAGGIELDATSPPAADSTTTDSADLGLQTLRGEIVDSKCFLGVMKPGRGKTHRACAARCISGGVPPVLRVETKEGRFRNFLLVDQDGGPVSDAVLDFVAEPIELRGRVQRDGDLWLLYADLQTLERLPPAN